MSFSYDVKKEICLNINNIKRKHACLYGMLLFCKQFDYKQIVFQTEHDIVAGLFTDLIEIISGISKSVKTLETKKKNNTVLYTMIVDSEECIMKIVDIYKVSNTLFRRIQTGIIKPQYVNFFVSGVFIASGTVTDPNKDYHLEYITPYYNLSNDFTEIMTNAGIALKCIERKGYYIIYIKESENIEDNLTLMGAIQSSLDIMNIKILKDVRNKANRIANCDSANIEKTIKASSSQIDDIELIIKKRGIDYLTDDLQEISQIRLENPELSLRELGEMLNKPIGRSGANHRMKKISLIAGEIRKECDL